MPLDGTELGTFENNALAKLREVERLLINEEQWCKGRLRDKDGRYCLAGAMQAVEARQSLGSIILRAVREVGGKRYWRIESFNDNPHTTHADVLRVLRRAREDIIAGIIEGDARPGYARWAQAVRILWSERQPAIPPERRSTTDRPLPGGGASTAPFIGSQNDGSSSTLREICEISRYSLVPDPALGSRTSCGARASGRPTVPKRRDPTTLKTIEGRPSLVGE